MVRMLQGVVMGKALSLTVVTGDGPGQEHGKVPLQSSARRHWPLGRSFAGIWSLQPTASF